MPLEQGSLDPGADAARHEGRAAPLAGLTVGGASYVIRRAGAEDVEAVVELLRDDPIGRDREEQAGERAHAAFAAIDADARQLLLVVESGGGDLLATMQVTFIPSLSRSGTLRAQLEAVRVARAARGRGLGSAFLEQVIELCRERGAGLVQLTSDEQRGDAIRFYRSHGFVPSHVGLKLRLD